ncbi:ligand-binding protein SH3 [Achromobacter xylosoxidans]|uniref:ligand-binding protein SH3 n=1 Tax=Alcaligenes xylosoxydans xylosoxydans TaxID=85698 RepID=UPI001178AB32|nr:ligand-binding protein SH3 [Achromobacter xylosoxidans]
MAYLHIFLASACSAAASIALKVAGTSRGMPLFGVHGGAAYVLAIATYGAGFGFYALSLRRLDLALAYPLMVAVTILAIFAYGAFSGAEELGAYRLAGAVLIAFGIFLLSQ